MKLIRKIFAKGVRALRLNRLMYNIAKNDYVDINDTTVAEAYSYLESISADPRTSCVTENIIEQKVDVHIIVPAYNVEKYIVQCVESVLMAKKSYTWHLTIINDGSVDNTGIILQKYEQYPHVEIITQENKGFSGARNTGLKHIVGKYVFFLDSDDCLDWNGVEALLDIAFEKNADIVEGAFCLIDERGRIFKKESKQEGVLKPMSLRGQPWGKVIKSDFFANLCFPEKYWFEDSINAQILYPQISCAYGCKQVVYYYRRNRRSITYTAQNRVKSIDSFWIMQQLHKERTLLGIPITQEYYDYILRHIKLTFGRIQYQAEPLKAAVFLLCADFIRKNFSDYSTQKPERVLEKILREGNFGKCKAYGIWF